MYFFFLQDCRTQTTLHDLWGWKKIKQHGPWTKSTCSLKAFRHSHTLSITVYQKLHNKYIWSANSKQTYVSESWYSMMVRCRRSYWKFLSCRGEMLHLPNQASRQTPNKTCGSFMSAFSPLPAVILLSIYFSPIAPIPLCMVLAIGYAMQISNNDLDAVECPRHGRTLAYSQFLGFRLSVVTKQLIRSAWQKQRKSESSWISKASI